VLTDERVEDNVAVPIGAPFRGDHITSQLQFDPSKIRQEYSESLRKMLLFAIERLDSTASRFHPVALAEFEQSVVVAFLM
jgi:hypothetical protein